MPAPTQNPSDMTVHLLWLNAGFRTVLQFRSDGDRAHRMRTGAAGAPMNKWIAVAFGTIVAYAVVASWPEVDRYRRMMAM